MRKKCKVCGAPLSSERCDYCGTDFGAKKEASSQLEDSANYDIPTDDIPTNNIPGFDVPDSINKETQYSQPVPMMMESKKFNPAIIIGIVLVLIIVGSSWLFLSNRNSLDAFALLESSHEAMEDIDSMIMDLDMQIRLTAPGISMDMPMNTRLYIEMLNDFDFNMQMNMEMSILGSDESMSMYYRDGYFYTAQDGLVTRELMDSSEAADNMMEMGSLFDSQLDSSMVESSSATRIDGGYRLEFTLNDDAMMDFLPQQDGMDLFELGSNNFQAEEAVMVIYLDENYRQTTLRVDMSIPFTEDGISGTIAISTTLSYVQIGNVTINFPAYLDNPIESANIPPADSSLLGYWENGSGNRFLWVFREADSVHFLENGTVIITEDGVSETVNWEVTEVGAFRANDRAFTYSIEGDILTITDSSGDDWAFARGVTFDVDVDDYVAISDNDLIGDWEWDIDGNFIYLFNADGTGHRGYSNELEEFEWTIVNGNLYLEFDFIAMFEVEFERWSMTIEGDVLTLASLQGGGTFSYIRQ